MVKTRKNKDQSPGKDEIDIVEVVAPVALADAVNEPEVAVVAPVVESFTSQMFNTLIKILAIYWVVQFAKSNYLFDDSFEDTLSPHMGAKETGLNPIWDIGTQLVHLHTRIDN